MSSKREIPQGTPAGDLAVFLVGLTRGATVRALAERFGRSSSTWGNYLNGSQLIPRTLLGRLVEAYTPPGAARNVKAVRAHELWGAADRDRRGPAAGALVRQHQRLEDALQQVVKYQALTANAEKHLAELRPMLAYTQSRLENARMRLRVVGDRERVRVERQLGQAKERLGRVQVQQERARNRRLTAEEQQQFWTTEALTAQEEINRLEREARSLVIPSGPLDAGRQERSGVQGAEVAEDTEGTEAAEDTEATDNSDGADDSDFDMRLEHIVAEGLKDEALIEADVRCEDEDGEGDEDGDEAGPEVEVVVLPVSGSSLDGPPAGVGGDDARPGGAAASYGALRTIGRTLGQPVVRARLHVIAALLLLGVVVLVYPAAELVAREPGRQIWPGAVLATLFGLPLVYGVLRFGAVPARAAPVTAVVLHLAWVVLLFLDALPWPTLTPQ
ncbi:helix-turn-helix domain-containing protein [Streptomyces sp. NPDC051000]|uniref:helix-turn-helix domain-containing protein n=1 Tax=Streptomyces sp. NPDC051000 TaxID=3155520 RepID=UPI0033CB3651